MRRLPKPKPVLPWRRRRKPAAQADHLVVSDVDWWVHLLWDQQGRVQRRSGGAIPPLAERSAAMRGWTTLEEALRARRPGR